MCIMVGGSYADNTSFPSSLNMSAESLWQSGKRNLY